MKYYNYIRLDKKSITYSYFMFVDVTEYLADRLFIKHKIKVDFGEEYTKEGSRYLCIFCKVRKRDESKFLEALEELKKSMLICGYMHYAEICVSVMGQT